jgi:hypothetical protein
MKDDKLNHTKFKESQQRNEVKDMTCELKKRKLNFKKKIKIKEM